MKQIKREYVHKAFDEGYVCVFPTEVAARHYLVDYALHSKKKAVLGEQAISFDTFRSQFLPHHENEQPSNALMRQLFTRSLLEHPNNLSYFINPRYPESNSRFSRYVSSLLPMLRDALESDVLLLMQKAMQSDVQLLYHAYVEFLHEHQLFEPRYEKPSLDFADEKVLHTRYCILFSDTIGGAQSLVSNLGSPPFVEMRPTPEPEADAGHLERFDNHIQELHATLRRIRYLLDEGVPAHDILLGCASPSTMLSVLAEEASLYDVPLSIREGKSPLLYPSGRFLSRLKDVYDEHFSLDSMKSLLLDTGFPWRDAPLQRRLLARAVDQAIVQGSLGGDDQWTEQLKDSALRVWYKAFRSSVVDLCTVGDIESLRKKLNHFQDTYFIDTQWNGTDGEDVYSFCLDAMENIKSAMLTCNFTSQANIFGFLLEYLDTKLYVPQQTEEGIAVYAWPMTATLSSPHHFVIALDHESSCCIEKPLALLPQTVEGSARKEIDTTIPTLKATRLGGEQIYLSYHGTSYEGEALPPSYFLEQDLLCEKRDEIHECIDPFEGENELWRKGSTEADATSCQQLWFSHACKTSMKPRLHDFARDALPLDLVSSLKKEVEGKLVIPISPTSLDLFIRCPYAWLCKYLYKVEVQDYQVLAVDHRMIGSLLHAVYQDFFSQIEYFEPNRREEYRALLLSLFDENLEKYYGSEGPNPPTREWINYEFREVCTDILDQEAQHFAHTRSLYFEKALRYTTEEYSLEGRIDRILCFDPPHGKLYAVIDYKKGSPLFKQFKDSIKSYQLPIYRKLVAEDLGAEAVNASYYSIKEGKYYPIWDREDTQKTEFLDQALEERLQELVQSVNEGHLEATPSKENCKQCTYRQLCRRRYATL